MWNNFQATSSESTGSSGGGSGGVSSTAKRSRKGKAFKIERKRATVAAGDKEENMAPGGKKFVVILFHLTST